MYEIKLKAGSIRLDHPFTYEDKLLKWEFLQTVGMQIQLNFKGCKTTVNGLIFFKNKVKYGRINNMNYVGLKKTKCLLCPVPSTW